MYDFALNTITNIVAFGLLLDTDSTVEESASGQDWVRVTIVGDIQGDEPLPFPVEDAKMLLVRDAVGRHVKWPKKWVLTKLPSKPQRKPKEVKKLFMLDELPPHVPRSCQLLYRHAKFTMKETGMSITAMADLNCFGVKKELIVLRENVMDLLELNWLGTGVLEAYMAYERF